MTTPTILARSQLRFGLLLDSFVSTGIGGAVGGSSSPQSVFWRRGEAGGSDSSGGADGSDTWDRGSLLWVFETFENCQGLMLLT